MLYVPAEFPEFSVEDSFLEIQKDRNQLTRKYETVCLFGDFNCRTRNLQGYITVETEFFEYQNLKDIFIQNLMK